MKVCSVCVLSLRNGLKQGDGAKLLRKCWTLFFYVLGFWSILPGLNVVMALTRALWLLYTQTFSSMYSIALDINLANFYIG